MHDSNRAWQMDSQVDVRRGARALAGETAGLGGGANAHGQVLRSRRPAASQGRAVSDRAPTESRSDEPPSYFQHNLRIWALAGPCIGIVLLLGGRPTALMAAFGIMACYCFDLANNAEGALTAIWGVVVASAATLAWAGWSLGILFVINLTIFTAMLGVWATLQFGFIYREEPALALLLERTLLACFPLPAAAILLWASIALVGASFAALLVALGLIAVIHLYVAPLRSGVGGRGVRTIYGNSSAIPLLFASVLALLPPMIQVAMDHKVLIWGGAAARLMSLVGTAMVAAMSWRALFYSFRGRLSWCTGPNRALREVLAGGFMVSLLVDAMAPVVLYVMPAPRLFSHAAPEIPRDFRLALWALGHLGLATVVRHYARDSFVLRAVGAIPSIVTPVSYLAMALEMELPTPSLLYVLTVAVSALLLSDWRGIWIDIIGAASVSSALFGCLWHAARHLSFSLALPIEGRFMGASGGDASAGGSLSLEQASVVCGVLSFAVLLVPGLATSSVRQAVTGVVFGVHAVCMLAMETVLISAEAHDPWHLEGLFPLPFVAVTGCLGVWIAYSLFRETEMHTIYLWVPASLNATKVLAFGLAIVAPTLPDSPPVSYLSTVIPISALVMAATAPLALFKSSRAGAGRAAAAASSQAQVGGVEPDTAAIPGDWSGPMLPIEAILCVFFMANALWACARPVISPLLSALLNEGSRRNESAGLPMIVVIAACGGILAMYSLAVVYAHFPDSQSGRRASAALLVASVALLVLQPAFSSHNVAESGVGSWREPLKQACALAVAGIAVLALAGVASPRRAFAGRIALASGIGIPVGAWSVLASLPRADAAVVAWSALGAAGTYACAAMLLLEVVFPRPAAWSRGARPSERVGRMTSEVVLELYIAVVAFVPVTSVAQVLQLLVFGPMGRRLMGFPAGREISAAGALRFALVTVATGHAIIAVALKLGTSPRDSDGRVIGTSGGGTAVWYGAGSGMVQWIPVIGNMSAILAAIGAFLCCWVHLPGEGARALATIPSCTLLLLLQNDGRLFRGAGLGAAVSLGAVAATWTLSAAYYILFKGYLDTRRNGPLLWFGGLVGQVAGVYRGAAHHFHGVLGSPLWNLALLGASVPSHARLVAFLLGGPGSAQRTSHVFATLAVNALPLVAGDLTSINLMGLTGLAGGAAQLWITRERQESGRRLI